MVKEVELAGYFIDDLLLTFPGVRVQVAPIVLTGGLAVIAPIVLGVGLAQGLQFLYVAYLIGGDALAMGLDTLDSDKALCVYLYGLAYSVGPAEAHADAGVSCIGEQYQPVLRIVAQHTLLLTGILHLEAFNI